MGGKATKDALASTLLVNVSVCRGGKDLGGEVRASDMKICNCFLLYGDFINIYKTVSMKRQNLRGLQCPVWHKLYFRDTLVL